MTTVRKPAPDVARRCSRCERVTTGVLPLWLHEAAKVVDVALLCRSCRTELKPRLVETLRQAS